MAYIPFVPVAPVQSAFGAVSGYTNGSFVIPNYNFELNSIAEEINALQYQFTGLAAKADVGSIAASASSAAGSIGLLVKQVTASNELLMKLNTNVQLVANSLEVVSRGLATISSHASEAVVTSQMALADQVKNNKHQQLTTEAAQAAAGLPKTVVTPEITVDTIKVNIEDVGAIKAQAAVAGLVSDGTAKALGFATTTVTTWVAESALGQWVKKAYGDVELAVKALFAKEKAINKAVDAAVDKNITMSGNATIPGNIG